MRFYDKKMKYFRENNSVKAKLNPLFFRGVNDSAPLSPKGMRMNPNESNLRKKSCFSPIA
jgi:hypothetical protein